jgi:hypothetical protein
MLVQVTSLLGCTPFDYKFWIILQQHRKCLIYHTRFYVLHGADGEY